MNDIEIFAKPTLYPNPASNEVHILFNAAKATEATLHIFDLSGRIVYNTSKKTKLGLNAWTLNTKLFCRGTVHNLILETPKEKFNKKMIINK